MAKFNINTFDPIYPEGNDKKGEIQLRDITPQSPVGENWTDEMRLDFLPVFSNILLDGTLFSNPVGRQTMYRMVKHDNWNLPWASSQPDTESSFLYPNNPPSEQVLNWELFCLDNTQKYNDFLNWYLSNVLGYSEQIKITKIHVINSNIQYFERAGEHMFFQTYDVVFYGQQNPNPAIPPTPPAPPCDPYLNPISVRSNQDPTRVTPTVNLTGQMNATLLSDQQQFAPLLAVQWQYGIINITSFPTVGATYALKVNADPMPAGTTVDLQIRFGTVATAPVLNITLTDAGITDQYFPLTNNPNGFGNHRGYITINSSNQTPIAPTSGRNHDVSMSFQLYTDTCLIPT
jgi:hypothetical protein